MHIVGERSFPALPSEEALEAGGKDGWSAPNQGAGEWNEASARPKR